MGVSTDGILAFGIDLGEDLPEKWDANEFDDMLAEEAGIEPWGESRSDDYWERRNKALEGTPVDLIWHCSLDYPMYILAVRGTKQEASRGYPETIAPSDLQVSQEQVDAFNIWLDTHGIEKQELKWLLCSLWG